MLAGTAHAGQNRPHPPQAFAAAVVMAALPGTTATAAATAAATATATAAVAAGPATQPSRVQSVSTAAPDLQAVEPACRES
ncbi:uncharacterized protein YraI [Pseudarthrobacter sp. SLBN-100]